MNKYLIFVLTLPSPAMTQYEDAFRRTLYSECKEHYLCKY
jgi:hypothetical protein